MNLVPEALTRRYRELAPRERYLVALGGGTLALLIVYLAGVQPMIAAHARLVGQLHRRVALLTDLDAAAPRLHAGQASGSGELAPGASVFATVSAAAQNSAIAAAVVRLEQTGDGGVRLSLSGAPFDALVRWLATLARNTGIVATAADIRRAANPGTVNATLTLKSP